MGNGLKNTFVYKHLNKKNIFEKKKIKIPSTKVIHISEFANLTPSFHGFHRTELTTHGKVWINLEKNLFASDPIYRVILDQILSG